MIKLLKITTFVVDRKMVNDVRRDDATIVQSIIHWKETSLWKIWKNGSNKESYFLAKKLATWRVFAGKKKAWKSKDERRWKWYSNHLLYCKTIETWKKHCRRKLYQRWYWKASFQWKRKEEIVETALRKSAKYWVFMDKRRSVHCRSSTRTPPF